MSRSITGDVTPSFEKLRSVVEALSTGSYSPTAAAVKTALLKQDPAFDERSFGFKRFVDFLIAAEEQGVVQLSRDANNHPRVHPLGVRVDQRPASVSYAIDGARLRREVWRTFVEWNPTDYWRGWDRDFSRVFMAPQLGGAEPPWIAAPERFLPIPVVSQAEQTEWMREFAAVQLSPVREALNDSLAPEASLGAFRDVLRREELIAAWSAALRHHVNLRVAEWASSVKIARHYLFESLARKPAHFVSDAAANEKVTADDFDDDRTSRGSEEEIQTLRSELHRVVDGLTLGELASIPVPARFLVDR